MSTLYRSFSRNSDLALVIALVGILAILFIPIPAAALDFFIICNFCFALLLLLQTFYAHKPVELSTFPSLLLIATLFRLALNIAATRLILSDADAGRVIGTIGEHVVGGNYVIGIIVFLILVVVQYVVVTAGAQRVAEVAARFTLDSMPGQQMSIDADLNMGFIDQEEAQRRRRSLEKEANFYGAMDGASKFVKGDAIAGIVILLINIVGGFAIGIWQHDMPWLEALQRYTLLTIGDGIVTQVPALIISIGTGIIVTRSGEDSRLSTEALAQMMAYPRTLALVFGALAVMLIVPGLPAWPVLAMSVLIGMAWWFSRRYLANEAAAPAEETAPKDEKAGTDLYAELEVFPLEIQANPALLEHPEFKDPPFMDRIAELRTRMARDLGVIIPQVKLRLLSSLPVYAYQIRLEDVTMGSGALRPGLRLLIRSGQGAPSANIEFTDKDPVFGLPAAWVSPEKAAAAHGLTAADVATVVLTHFTEIVNRHCPSLLTRTEVERLLEMARKRNASLVDELVPALLTLSDVQNVLQNLLRERVSIRNIDAILEVLTDKSRSSKDIGALTEAVRQRLSPAIYQALLQQNKELPVLTLDPMTEVALSENVRKMEAGGALNIDPRLAEQLILRLAEQVERMQRDALVPVLLCQPEIRRQLRLFLERVLPNVAVLALNELPGYAQVKSYATLTLNRAGTPNG